MSSILHQPRKYEVATMAGYAVSAASIAMIVYMLSRGWLW